MNSELSGFYKLTIDERLKKVKQECKLGDEEPYPKLEELGRMTENVIGSMNLPLGIATNFKINGKDYIVPMAIEEPSVVAAASNAAKVARAKGGFQAQCTEPVMIGQVQLFVDDTDKAIDIIMKKKNELIKLANDQDPVLVKFGGGAKSIECTPYEHELGKMVSVHLLVDCRDAMGANAVNTMCEALAPKLAELTGGRTRLKIISNLAVHRLARAKAVFSKEELGGEDVVNAILESYAFAQVDPYRCSTHNKGIMNGIDAVVVATGNDWRAIEAGAHAYASISGKYRPLTHYTKDENGDLVGTIELPMPVGLVGGATKTHPTARRNVQILGVKSAGELAEVIASVGLAQNFAALRALSTVGIQKGHMKLHARNIAIVAGAKGKEVDLVAKKMVEGGKVRADIAEQILKDMRK